MNKAEKKFRIYAILVIFVLLTVLLTVINGINFTMAAKDADELTEMISQRQGSFDREDTVPGGTQPEFGGGKDFRMGPMGPDSPEMNESLRYFTVAFSGDESETQMVAFHISAVSESDAAKWASGLKNEGTGWTRGTYRYRVYKVQGTTYVTVIDQGRELLPSYRILIISAVGEVLCLIIAWFVLLAISRKIYAPIEEADRKQKNFIKNANREFRVPLTVIGANTEISERTHGPDDQTRSTRRQVGKLNELVDRLDTVGIFEEADMSRSTVPLSEYLNAEIDREEANFKAKGIELTSRIDPDVTLTADPEAMKKLFGEIVDNALKYSLTKADFELSSENGYVLFEARNDTDLPEGSLQEVFDRFTVLDNAANKEKGAGLGLAYVKEIVKAHNGRATAAVNGGIFTVRITL